MTKSKNIVIVGSTESDEDEMVDEVRAVCRAQNVLSAQTLICRIIASR